jgi:hypothetical protein
VASISGRGRWPTTADVVPGVPDVPDVPDVPNVPDVPVIPVLFEDPENLKETFSSSLIVR